MDFQELQKYQKMDAVFPKCFPLATTYEKKGAREF